MKTLIFPDGRVRIALAAGDQEQANELLPSCLRLRIIAMPAVLTGGGIKRWRVRQTWFLMSFPSVKASLNVLFPPSASLLDADEPDFRFPGSKAKKLVGLFY